MDHGTEAPRWRGVHHLALITDDMDATVRFWCGALGARLVATVGTASFRHYFFEVGAGTTIAFFEYFDVDLDTFSKPAGVPIPQASQFDHLALTLPDEDALLALRNRLKAAGCEVTDVVDHGFLRSVYFNDPSGIALEASWWVVDPTGRPADYSDSRLFSDAEPVPAVAELRDRGAVDFIPPTHLVDEPTGDIYRPS
jgi:catechol 2,3-dioxygenase-like lactoylglutathione lyase family enzyme